MWSEKRGGGVRRFYVFQIMNINLAAADTKEHPITAIVAPDNIPQGLKPGLLFGLLRHD